MRYKLRCALPDGGWLDYIGQPVEGWATATEATIWAVEHSVDASYAVVAL